MGCCNSCLDIFEMKFMTPQYAHIPDDAISTHDGIDPSCSSELKCLKMFSSNKRFSEHYKLTTSVLGRGAFSIVQLGLCKDTGDRVAIKAINLDQVRNGFDIRRIKSEVEILSSLDHPQIIKMLDVFQPPNKIVIVTELVPGGELFDRIVKRKYYSEQIARDLIKEILLILHFLHTVAEVVHRDLKPENLLMTSESEETGVKLVDFGFASRVKDLTAREVSMGTPVFVAPEILRGERYATEVDMWSFGVICYIMLCGCPPFLHDDRFELFDLILKGEPDFQREHWSEVSGDAIDFVSRLLCVDQDKRGTATEMLSHRWITGMAQNREMRSSQTKLSFNSRILKTVHPAMEFRAGVNARRRQSLGGAGPYTGYQLQAEADKEKAKRSRFASTYL